MALIAVGSAACGTTPTTPQGKVENAFTKLNEQKSLTVDLHFGVTGDQLYAAMKNEDDFTPGDAKTLASLHAIFSASADKPFKDVKPGDKGGAFGFQVSTGDLTKQNLFEVRSLNGKAYIRLDLTVFKSLAQGFGEGGSVAGLDAFLAQADRLPASLASVKAALKGQWVAIDPKAYLDFAKQMSKGTGSPIPAIPDTKLDPQTQQALIEAVKKAIASHATYTKLDSTDGADHVKVSVPAKQVAADLKTGLTPLASKIPGVKAADLDGLSDVPNKTVSFDVAVKNGSLKGITFDIAQIDDKATGKIPLTLSVDDKAAPVSAPAGAVPLNPQDLIGLAMAGMQQQNAAAGSSSSSGFGF